MKWRELWLVTVILALCACATPSTTPNDLARAELAPAGKLRFGVVAGPERTELFVVMNADGRPEGVTVDLGRELARRLGVPAQLIRFDNPIAVIEAFRKGELDATFIGITADRAAAFDFGPVVLDLQTTYLMPAASTIASIDEIDRPGVRLLVPARSAQEAHLKKTISKATMISVAVENPKPAVDKLAAGEADAFSHVVPMLVSAQRMMPASRILPGSYYNVPIAIGFAKDRPPAVKDFASQFASDVTKSGFVQQSLDHAGDSVKGVVVHVP